jgi:hypothetical protein
MITAKELEAKQDLAKREGFARWMKEPMVTAMISMIPPTDAGILETVLRAAYESGFSTGGISMMADMLEAMFKEPRR